ncbi:hypothetical protein UFOVP1597_10 [uncultured Caudovirales phage]|jgi:hypothetical protein|uniref:Uncharacterized protein n=1 Tax=uncultured Caudovirales phage TaxID=2100421 RepID=A0A6J5SV63_9CAUD|nr:hypothetical protein UFOVP1597_10 [uncultured Caudovirales phage]
MSKLANKAKSSKLRDQAQPSVDLLTNQRLTNKIKEREYPRSYRLDYEIMNTLKSTLSKINEVSPKKVSEARLIKALIFLSTDMEEEKITRALKEVW